MEPVYPLRLPPLDFPFLFPSSDRQIDRHRQADRQTDRQTDRQAGSEAQPVVKLLLMPTALLLSPGAAPNGWSEREREKSGKVVEGQKSCLVSPCAPAGNRTRAARVAGEHSTTEPPALLRRLSLHSPRLRRTFHPVGNTTTGCSCAEPRTWRLTQLLHTHLHRVSEQRQLHEWAMRRHGRGRADVVRRRLM